MIRRTLAAVALSFLMFTGSASALSIPNETQNIVPAVCTGLKDERKAHPDFVFLEGPALVEFGKRVEFSAGVMPSVIAYASFPHPISSQKDTDIVFMTFFDKDGCSLGQGTWETKVILIGLGEAEA